MRSQSAARTHQPRFAIIRKGCGGDQPEVAMDKLCQTTLHSFGSLSLLDDRHVTGTTHLNQRQSFLFISYFLT